MKILFVTPYFVPAWSYGGPVKVVFELARELHRRGHDVTVVTTDVLDAHHRHNQRDAVIEGVNVVYFRNVSNRLAFQYNLYMPQGFARWCKQHLQEFDVVHCHDFYTSLNTTIARLAPKFGVPYIVQPHGALNSDRREAKFSLVKKLFLVIFRKVLASASSIVASTQFEKEYAIARVSSAYNEKTTVITNGIAVSQLSKPQQNVSLRTRLGIGEQAKMLVYFGRIQYIKGIDITLRALALLKLPFVFLIVGRDDGMLAQLKQLIATLGLTNRVIVQGPTFGQEMRDILATADLFVFNSRSEALPMTVLDACAAGLPSVLSPNCHVPEVATHGAGIVLQENSPEATAQAIQEFFSLPQGKVDEMRNKCHSVIQECFNLETVTHQYLNLYSSLTANGR